MWVILLTAFFFSAQCSTFYASDTIWVPQWDMTYNERSSSIFSECSVSIELATCFQLLKGEVTDPAKRLEAVGQNQSHSPGNQ